MLIAGLIVCVLAMIIIPLPPWLLDICLTISLSIGVIILLVSLYISDALRLASFPTILLISTLYRLALNISSTRLILADGYAGEVIQAFGNFVARGNFVVGGVLFLLIPLL